MKKNRTKRTTTAEVQPKTRYAVVGLGYIAQIAVVPAFRHASDCCELVAFVSDDSKKMKALGSKYGVTRFYGYDQYDECLKSGLVDAVYIALPNSMHCDFTVRAARAGVHVLCEKPMAVTSPECEQMIEECRRHDVSLMIAYRLQLEEATLNVMEMIHSGAIGEPIYFNSSFSMQVTDENVRTDKSLGGGALYDIGIYCLNAARHVFQSEPTRVIAMVSKPEGDTRFSEVDGLTSGLLEFGPGRLASFTTSFAASDVSWFEVVGSAGSIRISNAFRHAAPITVEKTVKGRTTIKEYKQHDQFAPILIRFSETISTNAPIGPSGIEGFADVRVIEALYHSAKTGGAVELRPFEHIRELGGTEQKWAIPPIKKPKLVNASEPSE